MFVYDPVQSLPSSNIEITVEKNEEVLAKRTLRERWIVRLRSRQKYWAQGHRQVNVRHDPARVFVSTMMCNFVETTGYGINGGMNVMQVAVDLRGRVHGWWSGEVCP